MGKVVWLRAQGLPCAFGNTARFPRGNAYVPVEPDALPENHVHFAIATLERLESQMCFNAYLYKAGMHPRETVGKRQ